MNGLGESEQVDMSVGPLHGTFRGRNGTIFVLMALIMVLLTGAIIREVVAQKQEIAKLGLQHETIADGLQNLTYVTSLTDEERRQLKLEMPPSLRRMMRGQ